MGRTETRAAGILLDEDRKKMIAWVEPTVVECFATLYLEAKRFKDGDLEEWLDNNLILSASRRGKRAEQVLAAIQGEQTLRLARERHLDPNLSGDGSAPPKKKRGWG